MIGVFGPYGNNDSNNNNGNQSKQVAPPQIFVATQNQRTFVLDEPAANVTVVHNQNTLIPTSEDLELVGDYEHETNSANVVFTFDCDAGDIIQITPFY